MLKGFYPVRWAGGQAVVALPEHIGVSNAGQVRDGLLSVINLGATTLIADMTATVSCDHAGADAMIRAWQRAVSSGTELRLVVTARSVSQVLGLRGLDRQVSVYPSLEAATAARLPAAAAVLAAARPRRPGQPRGGTGAAPVPPAGLLEEPRDVTGTGRLDDLAGLARDAAAAQQEHLRLLDAVITGLFHTGLSLQAAAGLPGDGAGQHVEAALGELDDIIRLIRSAAFAGRARPGPPPPRASGDAW
jgi:anti-anti-sigma regulatory factor